MIDSYKKQFINEGEKTNNLQIILFFNRIVSNIETLYWTGKINVQKIKNGNFSNIDELAHFFLLLYEDVIEYGKKNNCDNSVLCMFERFPATYSLFVNFFFFFFL
jgi:hypothetical protein